MSRTITDLDHAAEVAFELLARISTFDQTAPVPDASIIDQWAKMLLGTNLTLDELRAGVIEVYRTGGDTPKNKIGAVMDAAREVRRRANQGNVLRELRALPVAPPSSGPVLRAYAGADGVDCPDCGAVAGDPCVSMLQGTPKRIPCISRMRCVDSPVDATH
jgi:hypothetical protein